MRSLFPLFRAAAPWVFTLALAACRGSAPAADVDPAVARADRAQEDAYRAPPTPILSRPAQGGRAIEIEGRATPDSRLRLLTPTGETQMITVASNGGWRVSLPAMTPRLYGLAEVVDGARAVQSEGYLAVIPRRGAAQLRAGAGAVDLDAGAPSPAILAVDIDAKGGAVVSGRAAARARVQLAIDGVVRADGASTADGRFALALEAPLAFGAHGLAVVGFPQTGFQMLIEPTAAPISGPFSARAVGSAWRIDWVTPGGGFQTTYLVRPGGAIG